jgi:hypothetical protein
MSRALHLEIMWDYYKPAESLFFKDFKMESLPKSKLFKADKNKI